MIIELDFNVDPTFPLEQLKKEFFSNLLNDDEVISMQTPEVTITIGISVNDTANNAKPEWEFKPVEIVWRDVPPAAVLEMQGLFVDMLRFWYENSSKWSLEYFEELDKAGGDKEAARVGAHKRLIADIEARRKARTNV